MLGNLFWNIQFLFKKATNFLPINVFVVHSDGNRLNMVTYHLFWTQMEQNWANDTIMLALIITGINIHTSKRTVSKIVFVMYSNLYVNCRERNIFPIALINYITLGGGGFAREQGEKIRNYTMDELAEIVWFSFLLNFSMLQSQICCFTHLQLDIKRINKASTRLDPDHLDECNRLELIRHINDPILCKDIVKQVQELIKRAYAQE